MPWKSYFYVVLKSLKVGAETFVLRGKSYIVTSHKYISHKSGVSANKPASYTVRARITGTYINLSFHLIMFQIHLANIL